MKGSMRRALGMTIVLAFLSSVSSVARAQLVLSLTSAGAGSVPIPAGVEWTDVTVQCWGGGGGGGGYVWLTGGAGGGGGAFAYDTYPTLLSGSYDYDIGAGGGGGADGSNGSSGGNTIWNYGGAQDIYVTAGGGGYSGGGGGSPGLVIAGTGFQGGGGGSFGLDAGGGGGGSAWPNGAGGNGGGAPDYWGGSGGAGYGPGGAGAGYDTGPSSAGSYPGGGGGGGDASYGAAREPMARSLSPIRRNRSPSPPPFGCSLPPVSLVLPVAFGGIGQREELRSPRPSTNMTPRPSSPSLRGPQ